MDGDRWIEGKIEAELKESCKNVDMHYYKWKLLDDELKLAHVIEVNIENESMLGECWKRIVNNIAVYLQCEIDDIFQRSNFYICFFVNDKVDNDLIEKIENDQYSSKKYIFPYSQGISQNAKLEKMANKMFTFKYKSEMLENVGRVKYLKLKNFRSYCGLKEFDFTDKNEKGAQLVVIFAPNGYGKTSFFDAVEWNLTGKIDRLEKIKNNNSGFKGHVIANTNMDKKDNSYVEIIIDNGDKIKKTVKQVKGKRKQDYDNNDIDKESINGRQYIDFIQWNDLILPHHKIDNFVASLTPEKRYEEWGGFWDTSGENIKKFEDAYTNYLNNKKDAEKLQDELNEKEKDFKRLEDEKEYINEFIIKLKKYNSIPKVKIIDLNNINVNSKEYKKLVDKITRYEDEYKEQYLKNIDADSYINTYMEKDLEKIKFDKSKLKDTSKQYEKTSVMLTQYLKYIELEKKLKECKDRNKDNIIKLLPFKNIIELGEKWFLKAKKYNESNNHLCDLIELQEQQNKQLNLYSQNINNINNKINELKLEINDEKEYNELSKNVKKIIKCSEEIQRYRLQVEEIKFNIQKIVDERENEKKYIEKMKHLKIYSFEKFLDEIQNYKVLLNEINNDYLVNIFCGMFTKVESYRLQKEKWDEINKEIIIEEKVDKELIDIVLACRKIIRSQNLNYCPVCNNKIDISNELLNKNVDDKKIKMKKLHDNSNRIGEGLRNLNREIQIIIDICNKEIENIIKDKEKNLIILDNKFIQEKQKESNFNKKIEEIKNICRVVSEEDTKNNRKIKYSYEELEIWRVKWSKSKKNEVEKYEKNLLDMQNIYSEILKTVHATEKVIEDFKNIVKELQNNQSFMINFNKYKDYLESQYSDIENKYNIYSSQQNTIIEEISYIEEEMKKYSDINNKQNYFEEKEKMKILKDDLQKSISVDISNINKKCNIYGQECITLDEARKVVKEKGIWLSEVLNSIGDLKYNKEIDSHFDNYNKEQSELKVLKSDLEQALNKCDLYEKEYNDTKQHLENGFEEFFNEFHVSDIYEKIEPHNELKKIECHFEINKDKPMLKIEVLDNNGNSYIPEWYFSTAQLNIIAFSLFLGRALYVQKAVLKSVFIDDPIGHFDDMNIVAFVDLIRNLISNTDRQFIISTHEERVFNLIQRKIPTSLYSASYIDLREL